MSRDKLKYIIYENKNIEVFKDTLDYYFDNNLTSKGGLALNYTVRVKLGLFKTKTLREKTDEFSPMFWTSEPYIWIEKNLDSGRRLKFGIFRETLLEIYVRYLEEMVKIKFINKLGTTCIQYSIKLHSGNILHDWEIVTFYMIEKVQQKTKGNFNIYLQKKDGPLLLKILNRDIYKMFKKFYQPFLPQIRKVEGKYLNRLKRIGVEHRKVIEMDRYIREGIDKYIRGDLMFMKSGSVVKKDEFWNQVDVFKEEKLKNDSQVLRKLENIFKYFPTYPKKFYVWRGMNMDGIKRGEVLTSRGLPFSTSLYPYLARDFLRRRCCLIRIEVPANYPSIFIHVYKPWEHEVILKKSSYRITSVKKIGRGSLHKILGDPNLPYLTGGISKAETIELYYAEAEIVV